MKNYIIAGEPFIHELEESENNPIRCDPIDENQHLNSFKNLGLVYYEFLSTIKENPNNSFTNGKIENNKDFDTLNEKNEVKNEFEEAEILENEEINMKMHSCSFCDNNKEIEEKNSSEKEKNNLITEEKYNENEDDPLLNFSPNFLEKNFINSDISYDFKLNEKNICFHLSEFCKLCDKRKETQDKHKHGPGCGHSIIKHKDHIDYIVEGILHFPHEEHCDDHGKIIFV